MNEIEHPDRMDAIVASHRFNPGHLSHLTANASLFDDAGYQVRFRWSPAYEALLPTRRQGRRASLRDVLRLRAGDAYVLWFPSLAGLLDVMAVRLFCRDARLLYVFHEPFASWRSYREAGFSRAKTAKVYLIHRVSAVIVALSDAVLLPSSNAGTAFEYRYGDAHARRAVLPLMFDDEAGTVLAQSERPFVSYIGTIAEDHAFDRFIDFAHAALRDDLLGDLRILIATRSQFPESARSLLAPYLATGRVEVRSGRPMTNEEINDAYAHSLVVWNAYKRSMQSGVLPKAYMFGTPVLVSETNTSEFFANGRHGVQVSARYDTNELIAAVRDVSSNFGPLSRSCREAFFRHFHYRAHAAAFLSLLR